MKRVLQIVLAVVVIVLAYVLYQQIMTPLRFQKEVKIREAAVIDRIKDIRSAERAYRQVHSSYADNFDTLISFVLNDSIEYERAIGSEDDSVAVAKGLLKREKFYRRAIDTIFGAKKLTPEVVEQLRYIPYGSGNEFILDAGALETESKVVVQVFEAKAPYTLFLGDLDKQELANLIDERVSIDKYPGIKVGSLEQATNDAGNWE